MKLTFATKVTWLQSVDEWVYTTDCFAISTQEACTVISDRLVRCYQGLSSCQLCTQIRPTYLLNRMTRVASCSSPSVSVSLVTTLPHCPHWVSSNVSISLGSPTATVTAYSHLLQLVLTEANFRSNHKPKMQVCAVEHVYLAIKKIKIKKKLSKAFLTRGPRSLGRSVSDWSPHCSLSKRLARARPSTQLAARPWPPCCLCVRLLQLPLSLLLLKTLKLIIISNR